MTFALWVDQQGGVSAAARLLGVSQPTVWYWYKAQRVPRPNYKKKITKIAAQNIDFSELEAQWLAAKEQK
ncbi:LysR family transcriptional regulator [Pseudoalteromonas sp. MMG024]|uniref:helix-turn-helix domain-containing protein n=1 Tax=Pseudoalteromonas sp. MMG024 TaxID=2909980 RepID=UPI001F3A4CB1|nr:LysR family transcriptional regulator [Pseudoalteromonas sp. MMG024]MCF6459069.1 LysR family transcriptional regulator [Pseudoalteromonas sp. MMG024]